MFRITKYVAVFGLALGGLFSAPSDADAATLSYTISGSGSGTLNGLSFNDAEFSFELTGDSANLSGNIIDPLDTASFSIAGAGSGTFLIDTRLGVSNSGVVFFSRSGGAGLDLFDFLTTEAPVDLATTFSVSQVGNVFALNQFEDIATTAGLLGFDSASNVTFASRIIPISEVPLPAAAWMLIAGLGGLVVVGRRKA